MPAPRRPAIPNVQVRLLGDPALIAPQGEIKALERRAAGLLALVALEPGVTRARAAALLWPDSDNARQALRQQIARFRKNYGADLIRGAAALFISDGVAVDAPTAARGALLGELSFEDCAAFADWLTAQRAQRRGSSAAALAAQLVQAEAQGDLDAALRCAEELLRGDADSEAHHRHLIRLHYLRGDMAQAQAAYERLTAQLRRDFGVAPSAATEALARAIRSASTAPRGTRSALSALPKPPLTVPITLLRPPRLIGREREVALMHAAWQAGQGVLLSGEAGLGKSRLLADFILGRRWIELRGRPGDAQVPYAVLARALRGQWAELGPRLPPTLAAELAPILPELGSTAAAPHDDGRLRHAVRTALQAALAAGAEAVVFDDLQFADAASATALLAALPELTPAPRWLLAMRPHECAPEVAAALAQLQATVPVQKIDLAPLSPEQIAALLDSLQVEQLEAATLAAPLARRCGGNPLFMLETVKALHASAQGSILSAAPQDWPLPTSVEALIEQRLARLSAGALKLARVAALAGPDFNARLAADALGADPLDLTDAWRELESAQILRGNVFVHDLVQEATQRSLPQPIAAELHGRIARLLEPRDGEPARIAQHWLASETPTRAAPALRAAAQRARLAGRGVEAARFLAQAAALADADSAAAQAFDDLWQRADCLYAAPAHEGFVAAVAALATRATTPRQQARWALMQARVINLSDPGAAFRHAVEHALTLAIAAGETQVEAQARFALAVDHYRDARIGESIQHCAAALRLAQDAGDAALAAEVESFLGIGLESLGRMDEAERTLTQALPRLQAQGRFEVLMTHYGYLAYQHLDRGRHGPALAALHPLRDLLARGDGNSLQRAFAASAASETLRRGGDYRGALALLEPAAQALLGREVNAGSVTLELERARVYLDLGRPELAQAALRRTGPAQRLRRRQALILLVRQAALATEYGTAPPHAFSPELLAELEEPCLRAELLWVLADTPQGAPAAALAAECERATAAGMDGLLAGLLAVLAGTQLRLGDRAAARQALAQATAVADRATSMFYPPAVALRLADAAAALEAKPQAQHWVQSAAQWIEQALTTGVPSEFVESFAQRNPVNRRALAAAQRPH
ncbi:MAG: ATP-binding protein [Betaproteobacteria bacterium]